MQMSLLPAQIIHKKRDGHALTEEEIRFFVLGFTSGEIPDYQMAALAMVDTALRLAMPFRGRLPGLNWSRPSCSVAA